MSHALYLLALQIPVFLVGYAFGRWRPFRRAAPGSEDPHMRTVAGPDGKPVTVFNPYG